MVKTVTTTKLSKTTHRGRGRASSSSCCVLRAVVCFVVACTPPRSAHSRGRCQLGVHGGHEVMDRSEMTTTGAAAIELEHLMRVPAPRHFYRRHLASADTGCAQGRRRAVGYALRRRRGGEERRASDVTTDMQHLEIFEQSCEAAARAARNLQVHCTEHTHARTQNALQRTASLLRTKKTSSTEKALLRGYTRQKLATKAAQHVRGPRRLRACGR
jgi:hypothetical protein